MKKAILSLFLLALIASGALAQVPTAGWEVFVVREASNGADGPPAITGTATPGEIEVVTAASGQKAALGTNMINGATVGQIATLHVDRLDDAGASGAPYSPYFNIWITDGAGNFAVIANEPSNPEWATNRWDVADWNYLKTKTCKVYETIDAGSGTSWVHAHALLNGWSGVLTELTFEHVAALTISPPPIAYIQAGNGVGGGAPDVLGTDVAYGFNWVFGDTQANYVSGAPGVLVSNYSAVAPLSVQNTTQATSYATIEAALAAANPFDVITVDDGVYNPVGTLAVNQPLTLTGASEAGVIINIPAAGGYGFSVAGSDITLEKFTLAANAANENYPIHASGTSNPLNGFDNLTLRDITISGAHRRTGFDVHGFNTVVMSNLTSSDAWSGNGAQITGCVGVTIDNITTLNNGWGSFAIYVSKPVYLNRGSSNVNIDGASCSFGEVNLFSQNESGLINSNINISGYGFMVRNFNYRADAAGFTHFQVDEAAATAFALGLDGVVPGSWITAMAGGTHVVSPGMGLEYAVTGALANDTIEVRAGAFTIPAQIVIDKNLAITGAGVASTSLELGFDTGTTGDPRGWFLQNAGTHFVMSDLALDGAGQLVYQAIRSSGSGALTDCAVRNITYNESGPNYQGVGLAAFGTGNWDVTGCTFDNIGRIGFLAFGAGLTNSSFSGNTYTGKGPGDWLDYACDISSGAVMTVENNTITGCEGVASTDGSTSAGLLVSTYFGPGTTADINNNNLMGNTTGVACGFDGADTSTVVGRGNDLSGTSYGVSNSAANPVDFLGNWWGSASGPFHGTLNPAGTGVNVGDDVLFDPWSGMATGDIVPVTTGPLNCSQTIVLTFSFNSDAYTPDVFLYNAVVSATPGLNFGAVADLLPFGTVNNNFFAMSTGANEWTITGSTVGNPTSPVSGAGTTGLFTITFSATGDVIGNVSFDSLILRDPDNNTIPIVLTDATISYDCTAPAAVTAITATPGHNKVNVGWTHDGTDVDHYEVFSGLWYDGAVTTSAYPEYDDLPGTIPTAPSSWVVADASSEWVRLTNAPMTNLTQTWGDHLSRGVYYYTVFAVDAAGNPSPAPAALDRATNYWLGDVDGAPLGSFIPNGTVGVEDITALGTAFGTSESGGGAYNNIIDVGPTDDWSRLGIPTTDSKINFEDLMMFSLNFGVVTAAKDKAPVSKIVDLAWVLYENGDMGLRLVNGSGLKGLNVRADHPVASVEAGQLLDDQSELTFLKNVGQGLDVSLAVMGAGQAFEGSGDLFIVRSNSDIQVSDLHITARAIDNSELEFTMDTTSGTLTPRVFALNANYPNPFNPMTKISFSLPETQDVKLAVYSIDGRKVATLVNETRGPGLHEVVWTGRNDDGQSVSSGMYFYRIDAGPYSQVHKMTLMK